MSAEILSGFAKMKNGVYWFCESGKARGPIEKGFSRKIVYRFPITNPESIRYSGQSVNVTVAEKKATIQ